MRGRASFMVWVGVGLCGTSFGPLACVGQACTLIGCYDSETLRFTAPVAQVTDTDVSACRNARCWHGQLTAADLGASNGSSHIELQPEDPAWGLSCQIDTHVKSTAVEITVTWYGSSDAPVMKGDMLSATFSDSNGSALHVAGTVTSFGEFFPNGEDCDKVGCKSGTVEGKVQ